MSLRHPHKSAYRNPQGPARRLSVPGANKPWPLLAALPCDAPFIGRTLALLALERSFRHRPPKLSLSRDQGSHYVNGVGPQGLAQADAVRSSLPTQTVAQGRKHAGSCRRTPPSPRPVGGIAGRRTPPCGAAARRAPGRCGSARSLRRRRGTTGVAHRGARCSALRPARGRHGRRYPNALGPCGEVVANVNNERCHHARGSRESPYAFNARSRRNSRFVAGKVQEPAECRSYPF